jgi:midasin (ATPase involved in ribosome maturation)
MLQPNLCSAAVLDRLNSLLEPRGTLYVNECGTTDAGPRIITPHPGFRLFLVMDPAQGELSRAMRNRGIEIHVGAGGFAASRAAAAFPCGPLTSAEVWPCSPP